MLYFFGLLAITLPVVLLVMARGKPDHYEQQVAERDKDDWKRDRPAGPGAESQAVPDAGSIGPAAEPPAQDNWKS